MNEKLGLKLNPTISVSGTIANADQLPLNQEGKIRIFWQEYFRTESDFSVNLNDDIEVEEDGTNTTFTLHGALPGRIAISYGKGKREELALLESADDIVLNSPTPNPSQKDMQTRVDIEHPLRSVNIHLELPEGAPLPSGTICAEFIRYEARPELDEGFMRCMHKVALPIDENGTANLEVPTPNRLELKPQGLNGYWFSTRFGKNNSNDLEIESGDTPVEIILPVQPAGAIEGRIFDPQGNPAKGMLISIRPAERPASDFGNDLGIQIKNSSRVDDDSSRFFAGPLPLDRSYQIIASSNNCYSVSDPIQLTAKKPFKQLDFHVPQPVDLTGLVTGPQKKPIENVTIKFSVSANDYIFGSGYERRTDSNGQFVIPDVNPSLPRGSYYILDVAPASNYVPVSVECRSIKKPFRIRLKHGRTITGTVVDQRTGKPLRGVSVYATMDTPNWTDEKPLWIDADVLTDNQGRFRFTRLRSDRPYIVKVRGGQQSGYSQLPAHQTPDFHIKMTPSEWFLKEHPQD